MHASNPAIPGDFDELADWLVSIGSHFSPAELHGAIIGALAGAMRLPARQWALFGLAVTGADQRLDESQFERAMQVLGGLATEQLAQLASTEMAFHLFLPDDDCDIEQRTESLAYWCKGFLGGFAEARVHTGARVEGEAAELSASVMESLQDMAAIAQASAEQVDEMQDELFDDPLAVAAPQAVRGEHHEPTERDYVEVIEYLRLAALTVFTEHGWVEAAQPNQQPEQQSVQQSGQQQGQAATPATDKGPTLH